MGFFVVLVEHCSSDPFSIANFSTMTYENIAQAFRAANRDGRGGNFVGPGPRVTRRSAGQDLGTLTLPQGCMTQTSAAWLYEYVEPPSDIDRLAYVKTIENQMRRDLATTLVTAANVGGSWAPAVFVDYNQELNGSRDFWSTGQATNTRTRNGPDVGAEENRVGPDTAPQFQRRDTLSDYIERNKWWLLGTAAMLGVGVVAYAGWRISQTGVFGPGVAGYGPSRKDYDRSRFNYQNMQSMLPPTRVR